MRISVLAFLLACLLGISIDRPAHAADRVALVIGNADYRHVAKLKTPHNNAEAVAAALATAGFEVQTASDATLDQMKASLADFLGKSKASKTRLFYYSGHAFQIGSRTFLLPVEAQVKDAQSLLAGTLVLDDLFGVELGSDRVALVFLDTARANPLLITLSEADAGSGEIGANFVVGYGTSPGADFNEGTSATSPYSAGFAALIPEPGLEIGTLLRKLRDRVLQETNGRQIPWVFSSLIGEFYFTPKAP